MNRDIVTRFAPSPTGFMHVGNVRTALYAYLWARKNNGTFILRIEDTDKAREVDGSISHILESLKWLGLTWDEGPEKNGPFAPYIQSERLDIYKKYALMLIEKGYAYADPFTEDEVELLRAKAESEKRPFLYREYRKESLEAWDGTKPLRFKVPEVKSYHWHDEVYGDLSAGPEALDDFVLIKSDGYPTYNFAHIVDDIEMGVTHVMRGAEFISSTPKFLSVYEALGAKPPVYASMPHIMAPGGKKKLGKRDGARDVLEYRNDGYLPDAFINFLALMGWNPGGEKEIFTREELIQAFDIKRIQNSGAQFNEVKLEWVNKEHIKRLSIEEAEKYVYPFLPVELQKKDVVLLLKDRISKWADIQTVVANGELNFILKAPTINKEKLIFKNTSEPQIEANLKEAILLLEKINEADFNFEKIKEALMNLADSRPSRGEVLHPIRVALSGQDKSPDPFTIACILGKNETLSRLQKAI